MNILVLNAGSSSQKCSLYSLPDDPNEQPNEACQPLWEASIDFGHTEGQFDIEIATAAGQSVKGTLSPEDISKRVSEGVSKRILDLLPRDRTAAIQHLLQQLWQGSARVIEHPGEVHAIGHRVVHGGQNYRTATLIDDTVKEAIRDLIPLAPSHNPANLAGIEIAQSLFVHSSAHPDSEQHSSEQQIPQFAVFDTAFHSTLPDAAALYPVPQSWIQQGIRRYGFHGISHQYCAHRAAALIGKPLRDLRLVIAHLGNGCSLSAVHNGHSIDTTMGFTPLDGLMMGTRSGSVDPGILTYLMRTQGYSHELLDQQLNKESGLKGISERSSDMREIVAAMNSGNAKARLAFDIYIHRLRAGIAAMTASLGGLDGLVFTGGVGENSAVVRTAACEGLCFLGVEISEEQNMSGSEHGSEHGSTDRAICADSSSVPVWVIHTQEDWQIAQAYWSLRL
jgi:acetate kinase